MEEKKTQETAREGILENIFSITEKFISGLTSFGKKDVSEQLESFAETLKQIPEEKRIWRNDEAEALLKIFIAAAKPAFAKQFMNEIDPEVYFSFGSFLNEQLKKDDNTIKKITHEY